MESTTNEPMASPDEYPLEYFQLLVDEVAALQESYQRSNHDDRQAEATSKTPEVGTSMCTVWADVSCETVRICSCRNRSLVAAMTPDDRPVLSPEQELRQTAGTPKSEWTASLLLKAADALAAKDADLARLVEDVRVQAETVAECNRELLALRAQLAEASGKRPKTRWITKGRDSVEVSVDPEQACCEIHPDASGRRCMKPKGHSGSHWTSAEPAPAEASPQRAPKP